MATKPELAIGQVRRLAAAGMPVGWAAFDEVYTRSGKLRGRAISGPLTPVTRGVSRSLTDSPRCRSGGMAARIAQIPKLIAPLGKIGLAAEGMQAAVARTGDVRCARARQI